ncbi:MAG: cytochrome c [Alphaproteobacteria bacterium]|nr:cytochrome c [Alphaproteobacteria bacterium]
MRVRRLGRPCTGGLLVSWLLGWGGLAQAGAAADEIATGRQIASQLCARCHAIAGPGPSPVEPAPPFGGLARRWPIDNLAESLAEGIVTGHGPTRMPEFRLEPPAIDALLAYLKSVQE